MLGLDTIQVLLVNDIFQEGDRPTDRITRTLNLPLRALIGLASIIGQRIIAIRILVNIGTIVMRLKRFTTLCFGRGGGIA